MAQNYKTGLIITGDASGGIRAIKATDDELGKLNQGFDRGSRRSKQFNQDVNATSQGLAVLRRAAAPIAGIIAGMFAANTLKSQIDWGDQLQKTELRIGASTEALSQYNYVAKLSGVEFNQLTTAWQRQTRRIAEAAAGTGVAVAALDKLNLSAKELNQLKPEEQFERIAEAMQGVESSSERVRLAQQLWDSEGVKLVQIVNSGTDAIASMRAEADALGLTISQDTANAMATYNDEVDKLKFAAQGVSQTLMAELVPAMTAGLQSTNEMIQALGGAEVILGSVKDAATVLAALLAGRYAGAFAAATAAKLAATSQVILYQAALARMAGVSATAAASQTALAIATRGASSAMLLVGGPVGAAVLAAGALGVLANRLDKTAERAANMEFRANELAESLQHMGETSIRTQLAAVTLELANMDGAQEALSETARRSSRTHSTLGADLRNLGDTVEVYTRANQNSTEEVDKMRTQQMALEKALELVSGGARGAANEVNEFGGVTSTAAAASREAAKQTTTLANSYENLLDRIQPNRRAARQYAQDVGVLNLALATGRMNTQQYMQAMGMLQESFQAAQRDTGDLAEVTDVAADEMARAWEEASNRIDQTFSDAFAGAFDSFDSFADQLLDGFKRLLAELAYQATLKPIVVNMTGQMQGMLGGGQGGGMQSMFSNFNPSMLQNGWNTVSGWFGGGSAAASGGGLYANAATGAAQGGLYGNAATGGLAQGGGGWMSSAASAWPLAVAMGMYQSGKLYDAGVRPSAKETWNSTKGNTLGQIGNVGPTAMSGLFEGIDGALAPIVGGKFAAILSGSTFHQALWGGINKALFGGSWETKDGGVNIGVSGGDITGNQYERQRKSGGLFSGSSYRTQTSALDGEFSAALQTAYDAQASSLALTLETLGQQSSALNAFSSGLTKISTKGKSEEELEAAVQDWLQDIVNRAAQSVVDPAEYALAGETTIETLNRLAAVLTGVNPLLEQLHGSAYEASLSGADAAASLVALSGGMEQFAQRAEFYYQNFYSETERQEAVMTQAAQAMGAFTARTGEIITTTDQLRTLVDGIDLSSEAGRELYAAAMQLAPALVEVESGLERVKNRFADMLNEAESALGSAEQQARSAWNAFENQSFKQQITLLESVGDSQAALALQRERELLGIDPLLHETQRFIWAMEDEAAAKQNATQAAQNYRSEIERVRNELSNTLGNISGWVDQQNATGGTPGMNLAEAQDQLARQLVLAESSDRSALQSITQYADRVLQANEAYNASGPAGQSIRDDVLGALENLPDQISAEEYIAEEIKQALREQTQGISTQLGDVLRGDNPSNIAGNLAGYFETLAGGIDGVLTPAQLAIVMSGKATDAELRAIMRAVDLNGDGVMTGLESVIIAGMPTDAVLGTVLRNKMSELDKNQLTSAQIRTALSPIATDAEIDRLIQRLDVNGDGIISKQELTAGRIGGLAAGIAKGLNPAFDMLDSNLDGKLTFAELSRGLDGMATDEQLKAIARAVDLSGDGVISGLEGVIIAGMPTDSILGNVLRSKMNELDKNQLTHAQIRNALSPIASDAEIDRLIREVDVNGDGIISAQELSSARIGGLSRGIVDGLWPAFDMLDANLNGKLTYNELRKGLSGIATDAQIRALMRSMDLNGDGIMSQLESVVIKDMPTDVLLETALSNKLDELGTDQLTEAQIRKALSPIATDKEIDRLINLSSKTGSTQISWLKWQDGKLSAINSESRYTNNRLAGLARGIGSSLSPMFKSIDTSLDDLIDYSEFSKAFGGMATDKELRRIFGKLDEDGSGTISRLEALKQSGEGTEDNTKSLEQRAYDQLEELNGLVGEMTRTTDQFVGLNSGITSLTKSINALGVAQAEVARIEKERAAAEKAERERIEKQREITGEASFVKSKISEFNTLAEQTRANSSLTDDRIEQIRGWSWMDGDQQAFLDKISAWSVGQQMGAWTARRLEFAESREEQLAALRNEYKSLTGSAAPFADGGVFTNSIVSNPTMFDMGLMGEAGPEAIMPLSRGTGGQLGIDATGLMRLPDGPLPQFPALGQNDVLQVLQDVRRELVETRKQNQKLQEENNRHAAAQVAVQQEGFKRQINEQKKGNAALGTMASKARLEGARR